MNHMYTVADYMYPTVYSFILTNSSGEGMEHRHLRQDNGRKDLRLSLQALVGEANTDCPLLPHS